MVKIEDNIRRKVERLVAAARDEDLPDDETVLRTESQFDKDSVPEELLTETLAGFQMTYEEMEQAVDDYRDWLSELNKRIRDKRSKIEVLTREFEGLDGEAREELAFDLQLANDDYEELQDERDEVRAKYQILRRKKAKAARKIRRRMREAEQDTVDWQEYNSEEARKRQREDRVRRQRQKQGVRAARSDLEQGTDTEKPDMSAVREIAGDDKAQQVQQSINQNINLENGWLDEESETENEERELL
ncbi:hypothetical protein [Halosimplex marinum]|uniref:hypothetical protein n=1 Tax=Halosimplex marinum TaxID=3396620 RepID=UPI003F574982